MRSGNAVGKKATPPSTRRINHGEVAELPGWIATLAGLRRRFPALCHGGYQELLVKNEQLAFLRPHPRGSVAAVFNCSAATERLTLNLPMETGVLEDALKPGVLFKISAGQVCIPMPPAGVRVLTMPLAGKVINF